MLNTARSVSILEFSERIDICQLTHQQRQTNKTKNGKLFFFANFSELSNFSSLSF